jgi:hypothetical protein
MHLAASHQADARDASPEALTVRRRDGVERPAARPKLSWPGVHGCSHRLQTCRRVVVSITVALFGNNRYFFLFL